jgi:hypothetical protein
MVDGGCVVVNPNCHFFVFVEFRVSPDVKTSIALLLMNDREKGWIWKFIKDLSRIAVKKS